MNLAWTVILVSAFITPSLSSKLVEEGSIFQVDVPGRTGEEFGVVAFGNAVPGSDYVPVGPVETVPFDLITLDDSENEVLETIVIQLVQGVEFFDFECVIVDDDAVIIAASDTTFVEGETATISLTCTFPAGSNIFAFSVLPFDITATRPDDYIFRPGTFICTSSSPTVPVDIQLVENSVQSPEKTFGLRVSTVFTVAGDTNITVTILDNDVPTCSQPCRNGGSCVSGSCRCVDGFTGSFCESIALTCTQPCQNGGSCISGSCQCVDGYTGSFCESKDC